MRASLLDERHETACRLFNGLREGASHLVADLYAKTFAHFDYVFLDPPLYLATS